MAKTSPVLVIALVLVVALVFGMWNPFNWRLLNEPQSFAGIGITLYYADGTESTFKSDGFSIFPLTIFDGSQEVSRIRVSVFAQISMEGTVSSWSFTGNYRVTIYTKSTNILCGILADESLGNPSGTTWADGENKEFYARDHNAGEIENTIFTRPSGDFIMKITVQMSELAFVFEDGNTESVTTMGPVTGTWEFTYADSGISSVSLSIGTTII